MLVFADMLTLFIVVQDFRYVFFMVCLVLFLGNACIGSCQCGLVLLINFGTTSRLFRSGELVNKTTIIKVIMMGQEQILFALEYDLGNVKVMEVRKSRLFSGIFIGL